MAQEDRDALDRHAFEQERDSERVAEAVRVQPLNFCVLREVKQTALPVSDRRRGFAVTGPKPRTLAHFRAGAQGAELKKEFEREYTIPEPQTAQEVIGYYARRIAEAVKLPAQFAALAPKVREFFEQKHLGTLSI